MKALIDADIVAYRSAASAEKEDVEVACIRANRTLQDILSATDADEYKLFLTGSTNFRKEIYPEYKANRNDLKRPRWLQHVREYLVLDWSAEVTDGIEADDALGMGAGDGVVICTIDKDLLQVPGLHYHFVKGEWSEETPLSGWRNFYRQLVLGDKGDNVPGYDGKMRLKFPKFLEQPRLALLASQSAHEMYMVVRGLYKDEETLIRNARLLYIWRKPNDLWEPPTKAETTSEVKPEVEVKSASTATTQAAIIQSTERGGTKPKRGGSQRRGQSTVIVSRKKRRARSTST
jgi:hypothetical protein